MRLDELKQSWKDMNTALKRAEAMNAQLRQQLTKTNTRPQIDRIRNTYKQGIILGLLLFGFCCADFVGLNHITNLHFPQWVDGIMSIGCLWIGIQNLILYYRVGKIDLNLMSVNEALTSVRDLKKLMNQSKIINWIIGIPILILFIFYLWKASAFVACVGLISGVIGGVIGGLIGSRKFKKQIKELEATLRDELDEN